MPLHRHLDGDALMRIAKEHHSGRASLFEGRGEESSQQLLYSSRYATSDVPKYKIPQKGVESVVAYRLIHDELDFDGRVNLNLASFVNTYLDDDGTRLAVENIGKNLADSDEYPAMIDIHQRCVSILGTLWKAPKNCQALGTATTGSSEAISLGGLALKRRWQEKMRAKGKDTSKPNIIMGANVQVALEKFARYFEVEARIVPVSVESRYCLDPSKITKLCDENTIGIFVVLGSTYTGHFEPVEEIAQILDKYQEETGIDIPIHVDAASGGMIAPFVYPDLKWSFEVPRVVSINTSGHKFGLVTPGLGWIIWKDREYLSEHLIFKLHYLGGTEESYGINFSRPGFPVILFYYNLIKLGFEGYKEIQSNCLVNARVLSRALEATGIIQCTSDIHRQAGIMGFKSALDAISKLKDKCHHSYPNDATYYNPGLPVVSFRLTDEFLKDHPGFIQAKIETMLRLRGYIIPNYPLPPNEQKNEILRVVVRQSFSFDLIDRLVGDIVDIIEILIAQKDYVPEAPKSQAQKMEEILGHKEKSFRYQLERAQTEMDKFFRRVC